MNVRWLVEIAVTSFGLLAVAACATGSSQIGNGEGGEGGEAWTGPSSSSSSSSSTGAGGGGGSSSNGMGGSSASSASSASSSSASSSSSSGACEMPCQLVAPQCGCAAGQACTIDGSATRSCVVPGSSAIDAQCSSATDCVAGALCLGSTPTISTCYEFCSTDAQCTAPGGLCVVTLTNQSSGTIPNVTLCSQNCDLSTNSGCGVAGTACRFGREPAGQKRLFTLCGEAGSGTAGSACTDNTDCAGGYGCFGTTCRKFCKMGGPACPSGTCGSFTVGQDMTQPIIGNTTYGVCP